MSWRTTTVDELAERHQALFFDAYGVLVDGSGALPGAASTLARLNQNNTPYWIVTNDASRMPQAIAARLRSHGLPIGTEHIVSSGSLVAPHLVAEGWSGARCAFLGPEASAGYLSEVVEVVPWPITDPGAVDLVVITDESGYPFLETIDQALSLILAKVERGDRLGLVVPNPDLIYPQSPGRFGIAAGSIAQLFESAIQLRFPTRTDIHFQRLGKPYPPIYRAAMARAGTQDAVMIGDQLETDIRGAKTVGLAAALVGWGITGALPEQLPEEIRPDYLLLPFL
ncbi:MAG: HAD-IA family hydrolase [Deltaproteobacteria bacterium]|nr:HAD-IA family hydrolase [Deltaproteobacteria bacterium]